MSNNLDLSQVGASQDQKEVTINDQAGELDAALTAATTYLVSAANARTFTEVEIRRFQTISIDEVSAASAPTASVVLTFPALKRGVFMLINKTDQTLVAQVSGQSEAAVTINSSAASLLNLDSLNVREAGGAGGGGATTFVGLTDTPASTNAHKMLVANASSQALQEVDVAYDVGMNFKGRPGASVVILRFMCVRPFRLPAALTDSQGHAASVATASTPFDIQKNGTNVGLMTFGAVSAAVFILSTAQDFVAGDRLDIVAPASTHSVGELAMTFAGIRRPAT